MDVNTDQPTETAQIPEAEEDVDVNTDPSTVEEVKMAIQLMKNGSDGVTAEMMKVQGQSNPNF